jgi:hypothetical protein
MDSKRCSRGSPCSMRATPAWGEWGVLGGVTPGGM